MDLDSLPDTGPKALRYLSRDGTVIGSGRCRTPSSRAIRDSRALWLGDVGTKGKRMTVLMVWRELQSDRLWIVGDSRLSQPGSHGGDIRMTDRAAKVLEAHLHLRGPNPKAPPVHSKIVGFAYTGSSLIALQTYTAILPLWQRLISAAEQALPTMQACMEHLGIFLRAYAFDLAAGGRDVDTECILLGPDDAAGEVQAWRAQVTRTPAGVDLAIAPILLGEGEMVLFGSGAREMSHQLRNINPKARPWRREPIDMLRMQLRDDRPGAVGGGVQIGLVAPDGFQLCADAQPFRADISRAGDPLFAMRYRGFDVEEISKVGHTFVSLPGVSG